MYPFEPPGDVVWQMGCACHQCDYARSNPGYKDGMVVSLALVDETEGKVRVGIATIY